MDEAPGDVLTIDELADYLRISRSTLYKLAQEGRIPCQKVGRHWRFRKQAIDRWLEHGGTDGGNAEEEGT
jgi:excisionase family DNA binding protein